MRCYRTIQQTRVAVYLPIYLEPAAMFSIALVTLGITAALSFATPAKRAPVLEVSLTGMSNAVDSPYELTAYAVKPRLMSTPSTTSRSPPL